MILKFRYIFPLMAAALACLSCSEKTDYSEIYGYAQGGSYRISYRTEPGCPGKEELKHGIDSILCIVDTALSGYNKESLVSRMNAGEQIDDDGSGEYAMLQYMLEYCDSIYTMTGGAVDCRAAALYDIWGFGFKSGKMPSEAEVEQAMADHSKVNFNAVAQGYSADLIAGWLKSFGIRNMLVDIGGEFYCCGYNPKGRCWTIGIDAPVDGNDTPGAQVAGIFSLPDSCGRAVVTSGNYRKYYIVDGKKYSHTIDPRKGRPVTHQLLSATIVAPSSALADALATYCMVIGEEEARKFVESRKDIEACLISSDGIWTSSGLRLQK